MNFSLLKWVLHFFPITIIVACQGNSAKPSTELIDQLDLKTGPLISCGPANKEFGIVDFEMTCNEAVNKDFNIAVELLHSFEYDESEKAFTKIINESPQCAMAYWGVAMCNFHPLWEPPTETDLKKGAKAIAIAKSISKKSERESGYINAIAAYYEDWEKLNPRIRSANFEKAMEQLHNRYPDDKEAAIFYALALDAAADPADKTYSNQKKAGAILNALYAVEPNHPGIIHYIIHTYDNPGIATFALPAARRYAQVAPSSAHALHMPSHIFTRLGLWDDCIRSNIESVEAGKCYAQSAGVKALWDEEMHGRDYLVYAYLQKGDNNAARQQLNYIFAINEVYPVNFKGAYCFAAVPSRIALENKNWNEAARLQLQPLNFPWGKFPWQEAIVHFARLLGSVHAGNSEAAQLELVRLNQLHDTLQRQKDVYKAKQVAVQIKTGSAWIDFEAGKKLQALSVMKAAADMEDSVLKHPVTPGEVLPARELYADMLLQMKQNKDALLAYEEVLQKSPNRFNSLYGAAVAAGKFGNKEKAVLYFKQLNAIAGSSGSDRAELRTARAFLNNQ
jgi:hypothetical protein